MAREGSSRVEELNEKLDSTMEKLETLGALVDGSPEYAELAPYLRIAIASLRTAIGLYGAPLKITIGAQKLKSELKSDREALGTES